MPNENSTRQAALDSVVAQHPLRYFVCRALRSVIWLVASLILAIIALEIIFALIHFGEEEYLRIDPLVGLVHLENKEITWRVEGFCHGRMNSMGFLDRERSLIKPPGVFRIAVLGDSYTEGMQVPVERRFTNLLEDKLNSKPSQKFEVLNCGTSGFGTGQEYLLYLTKIKNYQPDMIILCINAWELDKNTAFPDRPLFSLSDTGQLQTGWDNFDEWRKSTAAKRYTFWEWARRNSRVWGVLQQTYIGLRMNQSLQNDLWYLSGPAEALMGVLTGEPVFTESSEGSIERNRRLLCESGGLARTNQRAEYLATAFDGTRNTQLKRPPDLADKQWQITNATVKQFATACWRQHCALVLVALPVLGRKDALKERFESLASVSANKSIPLLNVIPDFIRKEANSSDPLFFKAHFTLKGHELVADSLYRFLEENQLVDLNGHRKFLIDR